MNFSCFLWLLNLHLCLSIKEYVFIHKNSKSRMYNASLNGIEVFLVLIATATYIKMHGEFSRWRPIYSAIFKNKSSSRSNTTRRAWSAQAQGLARTCQNEIYWKEVRTSIHATPRHATPRHATPTPPQSATKFRANGLLVCWIKQTHVFACPRVILWVTATRASWRDC